MKTAALTERIVLPNLNGLRFFAALSVIIYHVYGLAVLNGHYGVLLFFVLSGFLITHLLLAELERTSTINIPKFYIRRVLRIWPLYFLIFFTGGVVIYLYQSASTFKQFLSVLPFYVFFLPNLTFAMKILPPFVNILWSVGSEEQFYLFWPLLLLWVPAKHLAMALISIILVFTITPHLLDYIDAHYYGGSSRVLDIVSRFITAMCFNAMATGALAAFVYKKKPELLRPLFSPVIQAIAFLATIILWIGHVHFPYGNDEIFSILFAVIIFNLALNPRPLVTLNNAVLNYLGKISYGLYVYHQVVAFLIFRFVWWIIPATTPGQTLLKGVLVTLATIAVAALSYEFFEKPFLKIKESRFSVIRSGS